MNTVVIGVACLVAGMALVLLYGKAKEVIGETRKVNKEYDEKNEREARAKEIESKPAPTNADDVATAWDGMRRTENAKPSGGGRFSALYGRLKGRG